MISIPYLKERSIYVSLGFFAAGGVFTVMFGYGLAGKGIYPDSLNLILLGGVTIGITAGYIFREVAAGLWGTGKLGDGNE